MYLSISAVGIGFYFFKNKFNLLNLLQKILILYLPTEIVFIYGLQKTTELSPNIGIASAIYTLALALFIVLHGLNSDKLTLIENTQPKTKSSVLIAIAIFSIMLTSLLFGNYHIGKMAIVDEPLWTFDRIPDFWKNVGERDWYNSRVSDKPGLTVAMLSGTGLFFEKNPQYFENMPWVNNEIISEKAIENFNYAFRFPIWLFVILSLPIFYLLLKKLIGQSSALLSISFIGLSPIMLGNARIINPDSILWIFVSLSIITYLIYLKTVRKADLFLSALFLSLGILTKYTANILYFFFLALIFAEYIFNHEKYVKESFYVYLKKHLLNYGLLVALSFAIFYACYPGVWEKPSRVLIGTIYSQAFEPLWPFFASVLGFILLDLLALKSFLMSAIVNFFVKFKRTLFVGISSVFLASILATLANVYLGMKFFDFENILASPKSSFAATSALGFFLSNFYPMIFGISIVALLTIIVFLILSLQNKTKLNQQSVLTAFYLMLFIIAYYLGAVASHVASIIRYQIVIFPIIFIIAGIAGSELFRIFILQKNDGAQKIFLKQIIFFVGLLIVLFASLWQSKPFYMSYASVLLPEKYYLDIKDMGEGSYEAAHYLNSLPNAKELNIWTDKQGVCVFFVGKCHSALSAKTFATRKIDYFVVSSGRKSRTTKMSSMIFINGASFLDIYNSEKFVQKIELGGRPNNFVKIVETNSIKK
ncbi:MAG: glycosyltransferase family 39 protein [Candidatus Moranbacteria bacterium]|nr:glycosyltransferase family 39 protein [Candidatus Moranbacteria bacterium]